ncbi:MAG: porin family protein [Gemmatimonadales bacterium]
MSRLFVVVSTLGLALAAVAPASAQVEFGVKGGASFGNISNKGLLPGNLKTRTGWAAGAALGFRAGLLGVGGEALFARRGLSSDGTGGLKLDYVDLPVYLKIQAPTPGISPFGYVGPQISFEVTCKVDDVKCADGDRSKTDYAGVAGAGVKFGHEGGAGFTVEARYIYGLKDLKLSTVTTSESFKTRSFLILGGIVF